MAYRVRISPRAENDLIHTYRYIRAERSGPAFKWYQGLRQAIRNLAENPERCPVTPEDARFRHMLYGKIPHIYRVIFRVIEAGHVVEVLHLRHRARLPFTSADLN